MFLDLFQDQATKVLEHLKHELKQIRTGRAQPSIVEDLEVQVEAYGGSRLRLRELATISAPDASMLMITPFDRSVIKDIEKAIQISSLGLNPVVDQNIIRLAIPALTQERREQLVKLVKQKLEEAKVALRNVRGEVKDDIEAQKDAGGVSEDDIKRDVEALQRAVESMNT